MAHFERGAKPAADTTAQSQLSGMLATTTTSLPPTPAPIAWAGADGDGLGAGLHVDVPGLVWGGHAPHSEDDFVHEPNVIVAHFADGVEVSPATRRLTADATK